MQTLKTQYWFNQPSCTGVFRMKATGEKRTRTHAAEGGCVRCYSVRSKENTRLQFLPQSVLFWSLK